MMETLTNNSMNKTSGIDRSFVKCLYASVLEERAYILLSFKNSFFLSLCKLQQVFRIYNVHCEKRDEEKGKTKGNRESKTKKQSSSDLAC